MVILTVVLTVEEELVLREEILTLCVPSAEGIPLRIPVSLFRTKAVGRLPEARSQLFAGASAENWTGEIKSPAGKVSDVGVIWA
jgi:hypothetical protein